MAELTAFGYRSGRSLLHRLDPRTKLVSLILISIGSLGADLSGLAVLLLLFGAALRTVHLSLSAVIREIRYFLFLLAVVFLARALSAPGYPVASVWDVTVTGEGIYEGLLVSGRLLVVVLWGLIFVAVTRPSEVRGTIIWFLRPIPLIPEKRVATMFSLLVRFIPVIAHQARETGEAQRARGIEARRNPVFRLTAFAVPLMRRIFQDADELVIAMEARCYSEDRTGPDLCWRRRDQVALPTVAVLILVIRFL
ncbi:MAG: energy-coupling factor transporter transmembrane component T family protein [Thermodesulfobacteriota bacterium]